MGTILSFLASTMLLLIELAVVLAVVILVLLEARFILRLGKDLTRAQWDSEPVPEGSSRSSHDHGGG